MERMKPKDLRELAGDPRFISGIYNYCDRWCERCPMTARCLNYAQAQIEDEEYGEESRDANNQAFWDRMHGIFQQTIEMLHEMAQEQGIDLSKMDEDAELKAAERQERRREARAHRLALPARRYADLVDEWFEKNEVEFKEKRRELIQSAEMELPGAKPDVVAADINDACEVVRWYQHQIYVKLCRALSADPKMERFFDENNFPRDSDGSAKVALLGMDRSIAAWGRLREHFPDRADRILDMLVLLDRLRRQTEARFPNARAFKRPGFDDGRGRTQSQATA